MASEVSWSFIQDLVAKHEYDEALSSLKLLEKSNVLPPKTLFSCQVYLNLKCQNYDKVCYLYEHTLASDAYFEHHFAFHYAYALYKQCFFVKSLRVVQRQRYALRKLPCPTCIVPGSFFDVVQDSEDERLAFLEAQLLYRMGFYQMSYRLYQEFSAFHSDDLIRVNLMASRSFLQNTGLTQDRCQQQSSYELTFNCACESLTNKQFLEAEEFLDLALKQCSKKLEDQEGDNLREDLLVIKAQMAFLNQQRGFHQEALQVYEEIYPKPRAVLDDNMDPALVIAVTTNAAILRNQPQNMFVLRGYAPWFLQSMRASFDNVTTAEWLSTASIRNRHDYRGSTTFKLTCQQFILLIRNHCACMVLEGRFKECERYLSSFPFVSLTFTPLLVFALVGSNACSELIQQDKHIAAAQCLFAVAETYPNVYVQYACYALGILVKVGAQEEVGRLVSTLNVSSVLSCSCSIEQLLNMLRLLRLGSGKGIARVLQAADNIRSESHNDGAITFNAALAIAHNFIEMQQFHDATRWYQYAETRTTCPANLALATAGKAYALACSNVGGMESELGKLKDKVEIVLNGIQQTEIDPDDVEQKHMLKRMFSSLTTAPAITYMKRARESLFLSPFIKTLESKTSEEEEGAVSLTHPHLSHKKRYRKRPRYPKGMDPTNLPETLPNPERWLPKRERLTYKKTKKPYGRLPRSSQGMAQASPGAIDPLAKKASTTNIEVQRDAKRRVIRRSRK